MVDFHRTIIWERSAANTTKNSVMVDSMVSSEFSVSIFVLIASVVTVIFLLFFIIWRIFNWSRHYSLDKISLNSMSMRASSTFGEDNLGYGALDASPPDADNSSKRPVTVTMNEIVASASQHSLNKFMANRNTSRVAIEQTNVFVSYSVLLNEIHRTLRFNLISVENLKNSRCSGDKGLDNLSVYVRIELVYVGEDGQLIKKSAKTRQIKNRSNPVFDETFEFVNYCLGSEDNSACGIFLYLCQNNAFGRDQLLGKYVQSLDTDELINSERPELRRMFNRAVEILDLQACEDAELGKLEVKLEFKQKMNLVRVDVVRALDLKMPKIYLNSDKTASSFIKVYMLYKGQCIHKRKTKIVANTSDPEFAESFDLSLEDAIKADQISLQKSEEFSLSSLLTNIGLFFLVMDEDTNEKTDAIGQVKLFEEDELPDEVHTRTPCDTWFEIFSKPDTPVTLKFAIKHF